MRKFFGLAALTLLLCVGACTPVTESGFPSGGVSAVANSTTMDEKAMIGLETSAIAINQAAAAAAREGLLTPGSERAVQVADHLETLRSGVLLARRAYDAGNTQGALAQSLAMLRLVAEIQPLITR